VCKCAENAANPTDFPKNQQTKGIAVHCSGDFSKISIFSKFFAAFPARLHALGKQLQFGAPQKIEALKQQQKGVRGPELWVARSNDAHVHTHTPHNTSLK